MKNKFTPISILLCAAMCVGIILPLGALTVSVYAASTAPLKINLSGEDSLGVGGAKITKARDEAAAPSAYTTVDGVGFLELKYSGLESAARHGNYHVMVQMLSANSFNKDLKYVAVTYMTTSTAKASLIMTQGDDPDSKIIITDDTSVSGGKFVTAIAAQPLSNAMLERANVPGSLVIKSTNTAADAKIYIYEVAFFATAQEANAYTSSAASQSTGAAVPSTETTSQPTATTPTQPSASTNTESKISDVIINLGADETKMNFVWYQTSSTAGSLYIGNHDCTSVRFDDHFNLPNESTDGNTQSDAGNNAYFVYNDALFIVINSNSVNFANHRAFIKKACEAYPNATWRIVVTHQSIYGVTDLSKIPYAANIDSYATDAVLRVSEHGIVRGVGNNKFEPGESCTRAQISKTLDNLQEIQ